MKHIIRYGLIAAAFWLAQLAPANASQCFWVGGTATFSNLNTTSWSSSSGGTGGTCAATSGPIPGIPGVFDDEVFDSNSGGGTVTPSFNISFNSLTFTNFTGTLNFATNNNSVLNAGTLNIQQTGGTATLNMGSGTWTFNVANSAIIFGSVTGFTCTCIAAPITWTGGVYEDAFIVLNGVHLGSVTFAALSGTSMFQFIIQPGGSGGTIDTINITAPFWLAIKGGQTLTITNAFNWAGTAAKPIMLATDGTGSGSQQGTISVASGSPTLSWATIGGMAFTGGATFTATNSMNLTFNSGITITAPATGGGGRCIGC